MELHNRCNKLFYNLNKRVACHSTVGKHYWLSPDINI